MGQYSLTLVGAELSSSGWTTTKLQRLPLFFFFTHLQLFLGLPSYLNVWSSSHSPRDGTACGSVLTSSTSTSLLLSLSLLPVPPPPSPLLSSPLPKPGRNEERRGDAQQSL